MEIAIVGAGVMGAGIAQLLSTSPKIAGINLIVRNVTLADKIFMLSRYEEVVKSDRDRFDRFPASASLAAQEGFLNRPIVNEYLEILWACLIRLWPQMQRNHAHFVCSPAMMSIFPFSMPLSG